MLLFIRGRFADDYVDPRSYADGYQDSSWAAAYLKELNSLHLKWRSYVYWRLAPFKGNYTNIDEQGLRKTWSAAENKNSLGRKNIRIFMFGGSTLEGTGA